MKYIRKTWLIALMVGLSAGIIVSILRFNFWSEPLEKLTHIDGTKASTDGVASLLKTDLPTEVQSDKMLETERYKAYQSLFKSRERLRNFFESADELDLAKRKAKIEAFQRELDELHEAEQITAAEKLMLQLALLKYSEDQALAKQLSQELLQQYQTIVDARNKEFLANPHPQYKDYKDREKQVVAEVMAMDVYPDGLSREAYLAKRLAEVRAEVYQ